jgi:hypothetical protein
MLGGEALGCEVVGVSGLCMEPLVVMDEDLCATAAQTIVMPGLVYGVQEPHFPF